jgi:NADH dehydrogenase
MRRFEDLCRFEDDTKFSIAVVGGGPTGVEMAGAIAELKRGPLNSDNTHAAKNISVYLIEAGPRLLPSLSEKLSIRTKKDLEKLGVTVLTQAAVAEVKPRQILFSDGTSIPAEVTIWAAGVKGEPAMKALALPQDGIRIAVDKSLQVSNYPYVFAIGDIAGATGKDGKYLPMVAPVAMQQARFVEKQIARLVKNEPLKEFSYLDKGSMATIGRHKAVVEVKGLRLTGTIAWYAWLWLHLFYLLGGRNKIGTMADWTWNYLTFDRGNRHIMDIS